MSTSSLLHLPVTCTAVLRDISIGTSYQIVRLVFRPYTHFSSANWTSARLISSIRISPDFNTNRYSSLSFGSYRYNYSISFGCYFLVFTLLYRKSPWSVLRYGSYQIGLNSCTFSISSYIIVFSFPSRYFFAIGLYIIFSFGCLYHPIHTALPNNTTLPLNQIYRGLSPPNCSSFHRILDLLHTQLCITIRALSCSFATTKEIQVCFFSCP